MWSSLWRCWAMLLIREKNDVLILRLDADYNTYCHFNCCREVDVLIFYDQSLTQSQIFRDFHKYDCHRKIWNIVKTLTGKENKGNCKARPHPCGFFLLQLSAEQMTWYSTCLLNCCIVKFILKKWNKYVQAEA